MPKNVEDIQKIYDRRFRGTAAYRQRVWGVLTGSFFNRWIRPDATVLDLGCGYGEFINQIAARRKFAMDLNPDAVSHLNADVTFLQQDCAEPWPVPESSLDVVFTSNFFEHLPTKASLQSTLEQAIRALKPGGRLIAVGPNIKRLPGAYWDYFDHHIPLTEASLGEVLELTGYRLETVIAAFLPYTLVGAPKYPLFFVRLYLSIPWLWRLRGGQFLVIAAKPHA
jgi:SAM-dependent methyltransferase